MRREPLDFSSPSSASQSGDTLTDSSSTPLLDRVLELTSGRMSLLGKIAHAAKNEEDVEDVMNKLLTAEKAYLLSRIGLIPDLDDDVMDEVSVSCFFAWFSIWNPCNH